MAKARDFYSLLPDFALDAVEGAMGGAARGYRATGRISALNSVENRVFEIEWENGSQSVAKFYRPNRWSAVQILEEHRFVSALREAGISSVPALDLVESEFSTPIGFRGRAVKGSTLAQANNGLLFGVFPKVLGRILDELSDDRLKILGRTIARMHNLGEEYESRARGVLTVETYGDQALDLLKEGGFLDSSMGQRYAQRVEIILDTIRSRFEEAETQIVHGDCHLGNVLWNVDLPSLVDFDDMIHAPPVQDIWMVVRGDDSEAEHQRDILLEAYEELREFNRASLNLIEPLRILRMIHYSAWIARRWQDPAFPRMFPAFGSDAWWQSEIEGLEQSYALVSRHF